MYVFVCVVERHRTSYSCAADAAPRLAGSPVKRDIIIIIISSSIIVIIIIIIIIICLFFIIIVIIIIIIIVMVPCRACVRVYVCLSSRPLIGL